MSSWRPENKANVIAALLLAAGGLYGFGAWQSGDREELMSLANIWATGSKADTAQVTVNERFDIMNEKTFALRGYHTVFKATYKTADGSLHSGEYTAHAVLRSPDLTTPLEVRYDPRNLDRFAVSWAVNNALACWAFLVWKWLCAVAWVAGCCLIAAQEWKWAWQALPESRRQLALDLFGGAVLIILVACSLTSLYLLSDDLFRRWDSYFEQLLGIVVGMLLFGVGATAISKLSRRA